MNSSNDTHGFREVADERAADSSGKKTAAHELSANGWRSALATLVTALMLILGCTGLWIYVAPFSRFAQVQVLVHVAAGLLVLIPYVVYQVRHFLVWRKQKSSVVMVVGYLLMGMTETAGVADVDGFGMGAWFVDLDNDGDLDLYVTNVGPNRFFENQGDGTFIENAAARGIDDPAWSTGVAWGDFDRDGHLDLYVCNYLQYGDTAELRNNQLMRESSGVAVPYALNPNSFDAVPNRLYHNLGDGRFVDIAPEMGVDDTQGRSLGATFCDLNGDGWLDLYVNNDVSTNRCWLNRGHELRPEDKRGTLLPFADFSTISGTADPRGSMGLSVGETGAMNNNWDGLPDLFITHWVAQENALYQSQNSERTQFQDKTRQFGLGEVSLQSVGWGSAFVDLDLDGREDLVVANGSTLESKSDLSKLVTQPLFLFWNAGSRFLDVASHAVAEQKALSTLDAYLARFDSPIGLYLHGYTLMAFEQGRTQQVESIKKYHAAAKAAADHAPFWFTAADTALVYFDRNLPDAAILQPIISESLSELRRLQPSNLWVIRHSLDQMAIHKDGRIFDYWNSVRPILERANYSTQNFLGTQEVHGTFGDYSRYLTEIDQVILAKDWGQIVNQVTDYTRTVNGKSPFVTDFVQLQPNLLDYLVERFSDGVMQRAALAETVENSLLKISFESVELAASIHETMAVDFSLADVDFDGNLDLFLLRESEVQVFLGPMHRLSSDPCLKIQLDSKPCGIATAYLGTVADPGGTGIARRISESAGREPSITQVELPKILLWGETGLAVWELEWSLDAGLSAKPIEQHPSTQLLNIQRCILVDYDHDADLDLVALTSQGIRLLMNRSNNTFIDASQWIELPANVAPIVDAQIVDWNRDVYIDLLVQSSDGQIGLLDNQRHGVFVYRSLPFPLTANHTGFAVAEIDGNASWDLISQKDGKTTVQFTETKAWGKVNCSDGEDSFNRVPLELSGEVFGAWQVGDFDNSGSLDFLLWADHELRFCPTRWQASPLVQGAERIGVDPTVCAIALPNKPTRGEQGDFDADGDLDLVLLVDGQIRFFSNQGGNQNNWLTVVPLGRGDNASRTNHLGIGGLFEVRIGHQYFAETVTRPSVHIGLGKTEQATLARIIWPNGIPQVLLLPKGKQTVEMVCILKGSCPFVYAWDGTQWRFYSDCLWAAPIGLQAPEGGLVPTRNWEFLRLPPDSLGITDGTYRVMFSEELWEVAYFDHVRLQTIDHPENVEVHINDKVGPPEIVQHRLYAVAEKILPRSAIDQQGRDVVATIQHEDQQFLRSFDHRLTQGYVEQHELILEFPVSDLERYTLFFTGWIQPTDTSINVMLQQHPDLSGPEFPNLMVVGEDGQWQPATRPMGFPGGKTKTMAVPLNDLFPTGDQRLKIVTSAEIYWDQVFVADTSDKPQFLEQSADLVLATLSFRGTARRLVSQPNGPELFDANDLSSTTVWPPVLGVMPDYGDVLGLVETPDDRLAILGAGDALELHFKVPLQAVPPGYRRTFLLYTVGYDKDSDLHTLEGQQVGPMPFAGMREYPEYRADPHRFDIAQPETAGQQPLAPPYRWGRQQSWHRFWRQIQQPQITHSIHEPKVPIPNVRTY